MTKVEIFIKTKEKHEPSPEEYFDLAEFEQLPRIGESIDFLRQEGTFSFEGLPSLKRYRLKVLDVVHVKNVCVRGIFDMRDALVALICAVDSTSTDPPPII